MYKSNSALIIYQLKVKTLTGPPCSPCPSLPLHPLFFVLLKSVEYFHGVGKRGGGGDTAIAFHPYVNMAFLLYAYVRTLWLFGGGGVE
jgi:hypothetical protein